jgi:hypothetical protein
MAPNVPVDRARAHAAAPAIEAAAARLNELRNGWLYPKDLVVKCPEVVSCPEVEWKFPERVLPIDERAKQLLATRTLTALYNENPDWLSEVHSELDAAVAAAYGWPIHVTDEEALSLLLDLNKVKSSGAI